MTATINGVSKTLPAGTTVAALLVDLDVPLSGIAVAVNECVVRRASFASHALAEGDAIEIIRAVAGG